MDSNEQSKAGVLFNEKLRQELYKKIAEETKKREKEEEKRNNMYYPDTNVRNWSEQSGKGRSKRKRRRRTMRK
jgi:hypothetical protein